MGLETGPEDSHATLQRWRVQHEQQQLEKGSVRSATADSREWLTISVMKTTETGRSRDEANESQVIAELCQWVGAAWVVHFVTADNQVHDALSP